MNLKLYYHPENCLCELWCNTWISYRNEETENISFAVVTKYVEKQEDIRLLLCVSMWNKSSTRRTFIRVKVSISFQEIFKVKCSGLYKSEWTTQATDISSDSSSGCHTARSKTCRFLRQKRICSHRNIFYTLLQLRNPGDLGQRGHQQRL